MASMTYVCKSCGEAVEYSASQDQDEQPAVDFDQHDEGVVIKIFPTEWRLDQQGRPIQQVVGTYTKIEHVCGETLNPPGVNFNLPAMPGNPDVSY